MGRLLALGILGTAARQKIKVRTVRTVRRVRTVSLLAAFTFGCNSLRHLVGGRKDCFSCDGKASAQFQLWKKVTFFNERHMQFAWISLFWVGFADFYVWMVAAGHIRDLSTWSN